MSLLAASARPSGDSGAVFCPPNAARLLSRPEILPNHNAADGNTPLHLAVRRNDLAMVDVFLSNDKVDPNCLTTGSKLTPLAQAVTQWRGHMRLGEPDCELPTWSYMLGRLVASPKVDPNVRRPDGETPLTALCKLRCPWDIGAVVEFNRWRDRTIQLVLDSSREHGRLDLDATNAKGQTPYQAALAAGNNALAETLRLEAEARRGPGPSTH